jgi:GT2 family glycosyltransferase
MSVVIGTPIRDRAWILSRYLESIYNLDYPKEEIILVFLINDSNDSSAKIIANITYPWCKDKYKYKNIIISDKHYGFESCDRELGRTTEKFLHFARIRNDWIGLFKHIKDVTHIFSIDSDILVPKNSLKKLIENDRDICSMVISNSIVKRGYGKDITNLFTYNENYEQYENILNYNDSLFEVDVTGSVCLIKRKVLEKVDYQAHPLGEDFGFCIKAKQLGFKVWCDGSLKGEHIMSKVTNKMD